MRYLFQTMLNCFERIRQFSQRKRIAFVQTNIITVIVCCCCCRCCCVCSIQKRWNQKNTNVTDWIELMVITHSPHKVDCRVQTHAAIDWVLAFHVVVVVVRLRASAMLHLVAEVQACTTMMMITMSLAIANRSIDLTLLLMVVVDDDDDDVVVVRCCWSTMRSVVLAPVCKTVRADSQRLDLAIDKCSSMLLLLDVVVVVDYHCLHRYRCRLLFDWCRCSFVVCYWRADDAAQRAAHLVQSPSYFFFSITKNISQKEDFIFFKIITRQHRHHRHRVPMVHVIVRSLFFFHTRFIK